MADYTDSYNQFLTVNSLDNWTITNMNSDAIISDWGINASKISNLNVDTLTVTSWWFIRSWKVSFSDTANAWWYMSESWVFFWNAWNTKNIKYDVGAWTFTMTWITLQWTDVSWTWKPADNATVWATWNSNISGQPSDASITNPSYITSTKITSTTIESPTITAWTITGSTLQTWTTWANVNIKSDIIELRNWTSVTWTITWNNWTWISNIYVDVVTADSWIIERIQSQYSYVEIASDVRWIWNSKATFNSWAEDTVTISQSWTNRPLKVWSYWFRPVWFTFKDWSSVNRYIVVLANADPV